MRSGTVRREQRWIGISEDIDQMLSVESVDVEVSRSTYSHQLIGLEVSVLYVDYHVDN